MSSRYYDRLTVTTRDLPASRERFLSSIVEPDGLETARLDVLRILGNGVPDRDRPVRALDMLRIQGLQLPQEERFQPVVDSSGDGQAYFFGRNVRMYQISAYMIDTDLDPAQQRQAGDMAGHLLAAWKEAYEEIRAPVLARRKQILRLRWHRTESFGYALSQVPSMDASQPNVCQIGIVFLSVCDRNYSVPQLVVAGDRPFPALLTYDSVPRLLPALEGAAAAIDVAGRVIDVAGRVIPRW